MPVRSSSSCVVKWPDAAVVDRALREWASRASAGRDDVRRVGYFGSYARGDWGVGSDLDVIIIVSDARLPFERRGLEWDLTGLPVPADVLVYTQSEWNRGAGGARLHETIAREGVWVLER
jgi:predicted nucleotidyltransferase